ncbi:MAG: VWA domain-containing protein [Deltaproteobacteria bacterium]|nr:VWA domain-containing protein [Deltaproteobacteria bacterium]
MRFQDPIFFLGLLTLPLLLLGYWQARRRQASVLESAGDRSLLLALVDERNASGKWARIALVAAALTFMTIALARPQWGLRTELRKGRGIDLVVALDLSRSMLARDVVPSRLDLAKIELAQMAKRLSGDRVGLVGFTSVAVPFCPLTIDHAAFNLQLKDASPEDLPRGGTAIADAIEESVRMLTASGLAGAAKSIVIVTDGEEHEGQPELAAKKARDQGIEVHVVGIGSRTGEPIPLYDDHGSLKGYLKDANGQTVVSRLNEATLKSIADQGGGLVALPQDNGSLDLSSIRNHLLTLKRAEHEARKIRFYEERFQWALVPATLLLFVATAWTRARRTKSRLRSTSTSTSTSTGTSAGFGSAVILMLMALGLSVPREANASPLEREDPDVRAASEALAAGHPEEAKVALDRAAKRLGSDPRVAFNLGLTDTARGELDEATQHFAQALENAHDPNLRARAAFALGNTLRTLHKHDEAIEAYRRALIEDPSLVGARRNLEITQRLRAIQAAQPKSKDPDGEKSPDDRKDQDGDSEDDPSRPQDQDSNEKTEHNDDKSGDDDSQNDKDKSQDGDKDDEKDDDKKKNSPRGTQGKKDDNDAEGKNSGREGAEDEGAHNNGANADDSEEPPQTAIRAQEADELLDAIEEQEKALKRTQIIKRLKHKTITKDW